MKNVLDFFRSFFSGCGNPTPQNSPRRALQDTSEDEVEPLQMGPSTSRGLSRSAPHRNMADADSSTGRETPSYSPLPKRKKYSRRNSTRLPDSSRDVSPIPGMVYDGSAPPSPRKSPSPPRSTMTIWMDLQRIVSLPSTGCKRCDKFMAYHS